MEQIHLDVNSKEIDRKNLLRYDIKRILRGMGIQLIWIKISK